MSSREQGLRHYIAAVNEHEKFFECNRCEYSTSWKSFLNWHIKTVHKLEKHKCSYIKFLNKILENKLMLDMLMRMNSIATIVITRLFARRTSEIT